MYAFASCLVSFRAPARREGVADSELSGGSTRAATEMGNAGGGKGMGVLWEWGEAPTDETGRHVFYRSTVDGGGRPLIRVRPDWPSLLFVSLPVSPYKVNMSTHRFPRNRFQRSGDRLRRLELVREFRSTVFGYPGQFRSSLGR